MTRAATENDKNVSTKIETATFEMTLGLPKSSEKKFGKSSATLMQENQIIRW